MKYLLSLLLLFPIAAFSQNISPGQAKDSIGKTETVCGQVFGVHTDTSGVTFLNMGAAYPNQTFTVVVSKDSVTNFSYPISNLGNKIICVTGVITSYKGQPEIIVNSGKQIEMPQ